LETEKWIYVLNRMGYEIFILSGQFERSVLDKKHQTQNKSLSFFSEDNQTIQKLAFSKSGKNEKKIVAEIKKHGESIAGTIKRWIKKNKIDILISENVSSLPYPLALGIGIKKAVKDLNIKVIAHDHDFYWERGNRYKSPYTEINNLIKTSFPLTGKNIKHAVINTNAKRILAEKYNIKSVLVPNVMDFKSDFGSPNVRSKSLFKDLGLKKGDIVLFQVTRIIERKGIETAIELIRKLGDKNIKLVITGDDADDSHGYVYFLKNLAERLGVRDQIIFAGKCFEKTSLFTGNKNSCRFKKNTKKVYSISDAYSCADACTYFSKYEGFGNAFIEAVLAKKPIFVNDYKPVFWQEIGKKGFRTVMLENDKLTKKAVKKIREILCNKKLAKEITNYNYEIGKKYFSYEVLEKKLKELLKF